MDIAIRQHDQGRCDKCRAIRWLYELIDVVPAKRLCVRCIAEAVPAPAAAPPSLGAGR